MDNWKKALNKFLQRYVDEAFFEGALLCGSYASGNQDEYSDIDVHIVTANTETRRERGNCRVDGYMVEYFINPAYQIERYLDDDWKNGTNCNACMFSCGKILYDRHGEMKRLRELAGIYLNKRFQEMDEYKRKMAFYYVWDDLDEITSMQKKGLRTDIVYNQALLRLVKLYCAYHKIPQIVPSKLERILSDQAYAERYGFEAKLPAEFSQAVLACIRSRPEEGEKNLRRLYEFVVSACGGFEINGFKLNSLAEKQVG